MIYVFEHWTFIRKLWNIRVTWNLGINFFKRFRFLIETVIWKLWNRCMWDATVQSEIMWFCVKIYISYGMERKWNLSFFFFEFYFYCSNGIRSNRSCSLPLFNVKIQRIIPHLLEFSFTLEKFDPDRYVRGLRYAICIMSSTFAA